MIVIGAAKPPQTNPLPNDHIAQIARYVGRLGEELESAFKPVYAGLNSTTANALSTTEVVSAAKVGDAVILFPKDATAAAMSGVYGEVVMVADVANVVVTHPSQVATGVFNVLVVAV